LQHQFHKKMFAMLPKIKPGWFLLIGIATITATHLIFNIALAAWVSSVPFLLYLRTTRGLKSRWLFVTALLAAWSLCVAKIISPPLPYFFVFLFSIPISLLHLPGYLLWDRFKNHSGAIFLFPAVMTVMEWIQYTFTPFASWGIAAYTQADNLALMQSVSLFGLPGLSFLIYWVNISIAEILASGKASRQILHFPLAVLLFFILFGSMRYAMGKSQGVDTVLVAAVGTDSKVSGLPLPGKESNEQVKAALFARSAQAAKNGATLVVWNEAALFVLPEEESVWQDSLGALAARLHISLVAAYVMPISTAPLQYENKYLFFDPNGTITYKYHKHQPVPGEPCVPGDEPLKVFDMADSKVGGAICYDYDFPYLAKEFRKLDADIVALPSSDWRGIDPIHTKMAAFRAVEQGHSILRSTRFGLSAAITPYGEMTAQMSSFDNNDKIMTAHLPAKGIWTLYSKIGDLVVWICFAWIGFLVFFIPRINILRRKTTETSAAYASDRSTSDQL
jgi:apolipoprotein N-acyltransferase